MGQDSILLFFFSSFFSFGFFKSKETSLEYPPNVEIVSTKNSTYFPQVANYTYYLIALY